MQVEWCRARDAAGGEGGERVRVAGGGRGYVDVAGTGGETAGGEVVSK